MFKFIDGVAWFLGSAAMGILYDTSMPALVALSMALELLAIPVLVRVRTRQATKTPSSAA